MIAVAALALFLQQTPLQPATPQAATKSSEPFGFQDSQLGARYDEWRASHPEANCFKGKVALEMVCEGKKPAFITTFGGVKYRFFPGAGEVMKLFEIEIMASMRDRSDIMNGLLGKWGDPDRADGVVTVWERPTSKITFFDLGNGVSASISDDEITARYKAAQKVSAAGAF